MSLLFVSLSMGCSWFDDNHGSIEMTSSASDVPEDYQCIQNFFPIKFHDFDADQPFDHFTRIRMFESIYQTMESNYLTITFASEDPETFEACPEPEANHSYEITRSGCIRATLQLNGYESPTMLDKFADSKNKTPKSEKKCEDAFTVHLTGTLDIGELSFDRDKRITGKMTGELAYYNRLETTEATVVENRILLGNFEGSFSFVNHVGAAWDN